MSNVRFIGYGPRSGEKQASSPRSDLASFQQCLFRRLCKSEFKGVDRRKALELCRQVYRVAHGRAGTRLTSAVADVACGAVRQGLGPHAAFRVTGMALSLLGLEMPVGLGRALKQFILEASSS